MNDSGHTDRYWATAPVEELAEEVHTQMRRYVEHLRNSGRMELLRRAHNLYYGLDAEGGWTNSAAITTGGEQGELLQLRANEFRSLCEHTLSLTTGSRPSFTARSTNADFESQAQVKLAEQALDYYLDEKNLEGIAIHACEHGIVCGEGWGYIGWDEEAGDDYGTEERPVFDESGQALTQMVEAIDPATGEAVETEQPVTEEKVIRTGDIDARVYHEVDICRDVDLESHEDIQWIVAHRKVNRWDLAERFPEMRADILNAPTTADYAEDLHIRRTHSDENYDRVSTLEFWHDRTPSMPYGRYALVCGDAVLLDTPLPFEDLPFIPLSPSQEMRSSFGYTKSFDLMALQAAYDACIGTAVTNHDAFGVTRLWVEKGSDVSVKDLGSAMVLLESPNKPEVLDLEGTNKGSFDLMERLQANMEQVSGINSVARGNPQASLKSGSALALVHSMALDYNSGLQRAYARFWEQMGTKTLSRLRSFAKVPRVIAIGGKNNAGAMRQFKAEDIDNVRRIKVELGSAVLRTAAGRKEIADKLLELGIITDPRKYLEVISTGRLDPVLDGPRNHRLLIVAENEAMAEGKMVRAVMTDDHAAHIAEHRTLIDDVSIRQAGDERLQHILAHIMEHANLWAGMSPDLLAALGQQPSPIAMQAAGGDPMAAAPQPGGAPVAPNPNPEPPMPALAPSAAEQMANPPQGGTVARMPNMPEPPPNASPQVRNELVNGGKLS